MALDRRQGRFEHKLQQSIAMNDDHIDRRRGYLDSLIAEIAEGQDRLQRCVNAADQREQERIGMRVKHRVIKSAQMARLSADHQSDIADLEAKMKDVSRSLAHDFEESIERVDGFVQDKLKERLRPLDGEIARTQATIDRRRSGHTMDSVFDGQMDGGAEDEDEFAKAEACAKARIDSLEKSIHEQTAARLATMTAHRDRLAESIKTLEDMERAHMSQVEGLRQKLAAKDAKYEGKVESLTTDQGRYRTQMKHKIQAAERKVAKIEVATKRAEEKHGKRITTLATENETLRRDCQNKKAKETAVRDDASSIRKMNEKMTLASRELAAREEVLAHMRVDNEKMKREIARIEHEASIARRRAKLNL